MGDGTFASRGAPQPILNDSTSGMYNRRVAEVACENKACLVLTNDNTLVGWGYYIRRSTDDPVPVIIPPGAINTREIFKIAMGYTFELVLTTDNRLFAWGQRVSLGDPTFSQSSDPNYRFIPSPVYMDGALSGKTVSSIYAGGSLSAVITAG